MPAWLAVIEQVPNLTTTIARLEIVQISVEFEIKVTGYKLPALLVAVRAWLLLLVFIAAGWVNVMDWLNLFSAIPIDLITPLAGK